ncbi:MAG: PDZ domain-containing protein [Bdellovibrionales bacterium]|nr:PDZ domain-containing protein [Bdellovibrionales bacterium]
MLKRPRLIVSALLIVAMGAFIAFGKAQKLSKVKTADEYWAETGLGSQTLEELLQEGSCSSSERYFYACVNAVQSVAQKYGFDLSTDGRLVPTSKTTSQAISEKELLAPWKVYLSSQAQIPNFPFMKVWKELVNDHIEAEKLSAAVGLGMNGFLSVFRDPHTYLMPAKMYNEVVAKANPRSLSIGVVIGRSDKQYFIKKVIENSSSFIAGLRKGDVLLSIDGKKAQVMSMQELSDSLRGEEGSTLRLSVLRHGDLKMINVLRTQQTLPTVSYQVLEGIKPVGVLTINKFAIDACTEVKGALQHLKQQGIRGLLLDLRDNPGGQMDEAACVTGLFVGLGKKVFQIKPIVPDVEEETAYSEQEQEYDGSMAVLINSGSASAAEIVAGALQDYHRAILVGERSFGKGSFQEGEIWSKNSEIAIFETKGFYYLPSGRTPQMVGLEPDVKVNFKDSFALREQDQFWYPLMAPNAISTIGVAADLQPDLATCISFDSDFLSPDDPEIKEAHRVLSCRGIAERGER